VVASPLKRIQGGKSRAELQRASRAFWEIVRDSLVELHGHSGDEASTKIDGVRQRIASRSNDPGDDIIYHSEPFDVACRLANRDLPWEPVRDVYAEIVRRHQADIGGTAPSRQVMRSHQEAS
jgi:hypothetical protein